MDKNGTLYTVLFAAAVCLVCGIAVAASAVGLSQRQEQNRIIDKKEKVLAAAGLLPEGQVTSTQINRIFEERVEPRVVNLETGREAEGIDPVKFDQKAAMKDPQRSSPAPPNDAQVRRIPENGLIYEVREEGELSTLVLPVQGKGLWSTLYGFLALDADTVTIKGLIFYQHGETPGLGGEVDNPRWRRLWIGRKALDEMFEPVIEVIKGPAGPPEEEPHKVDGLSGATITSRGVTHLLRFWLGEHGYGPTLAQYRLGLGQQGSGPSSHEGSTDKPGRGSKRQEEAQ